MPRVILLSDHTLFAEGIQTWLQQNQDGVEFQIVEGSNPEALTQVIAACPVAVILDDSVLDHSNLITLDRLLKALPSVRIIRLDACSEKIQVIDCERLSLAKVSDLVDLILLDI